MSSTGAPPSTDVKVEGQRGRTITFVWLLPVAQRESQSSDQTKAKAPFNGDREPALWRRSRLLSHPLTPEPFYHCLVLAGGSCGGTVISLCRAQTLTFPQLVKVAIGSLRLSMSHQSSCLRTAVDVSALPQALTLVDK